MTRVLRMLLPPTYLGRDCSVGIQIQGWRILEWSPVYPIQTSIVVSCRQFPHISHVFVMCAWPVICRIPSYRPWPTSPSFCLYRYFGAPTRWSRGNNLRSFRIPAFGSLGESPVDGVRSTLLNPCSSSMCHISTQPLATEFQPVPQVPS